jgi:hypothetical protein
MHGPCGSSCGDRWRRNVQTRNVFSPCSMTDVGRDDFIKGTGIDSCTFRPVSANRFEKEAASASGNCRHLAACSGFLRPAECSPATQQAVHGQLGGCLMVCVDLVFAGEGMFYAVPSPSRQRLANISARSLETTRPAGNRSGEAVQRDLERSIWRHPRRHEPECQSARRVVSSSVASVIRRGCQEKGSL